MPLLNESYEEFVLNENTNLEYKDFFGKKVSHTEAFKERINSAIIDIIMNERKVSEKSFKEYDNIINEVKQKCKECYDIYKVANDLYNSGKRIPYIAEQLYDTYFVEDKNAN